MPRRLGRRLRRNAGGVAKLLAKEALRTKNLLGLVGLAVGLAALGGSAGALLAGRAISTAVFAGVGGAALYGATRSFLGSPLRGVAVFLGVVVVLGGAVHALGVGPADSGSDVGTDVPTAVGNDEPESESSPATGEDGKASDETESDHGYDYEYGCDGDI